MVKLNELRWTNVNRNNIIGGTDMSVLLGMNKWKTKEELIEEKLHDKQVEMNDSMYWGIMAEPMIARHISNNLPEGQFLFDPEDPMFATALSLEIEGHQVEHKDYPFIVGSPDRLVVKNGTLEILEGIEIKTAFEWTLKSWKKQVPMYYQIQCQHYMLVTGLDTWKICALIGNRTYLEFDLEADYLLHEEMIEKATEFHSEMESLIERGAKEALEKYEQLLTEDSKNKCIPMGKS